MLYEKSYFVVSRSQIMSTRRKCLKAASCQRQDRGQAWVITLIWVYDERNVAWEGVISWTLEAW